MKQIKGISLENFKRNKTNSIININKEELQQNIKNILLTATNERRFIDFECSSLYKELFEQQDDSNIPLIKDNIIRAIEKEESRIKLISVDISYIDNESNSEIKHASDESSLFVTIRYKLIEEITDKITKYTVEI